MRPSPPRRARRRHCSSSHPTGEPNLFPPPTAPAAAVGEVGRSMVQIPAPFRESSPQILILPLFHIHTSRPPFFYLPVHKRMGKAYCTQASSSVCTAPSSLPPLCGDVCPLLPLLIEWRQISFSSRATNTSPPLFSPFLLSSFSNLIRRRRRRSLGAREDEGALPLCCISFFETPPGWEDEKNLVFPDCWSSPSGRRRTRSLEALFPLLRFCFSGFQGLLLFPCGLKCKE